MKRCAWVVLSAFGLLWIYVATTNAQSAEDTVDAHVAAAKVLAANEKTALITLCNPRWLRPAEVLLHEARSLRLRPIARVGHENR